MADSQFYRAVVRAVPARLDKTRVVNCRSDNFGNQVAARKTHPRTRAASMIDRAIDRSRFENKGVAASRGDRVRACISRGNLRARMRNFEMKNGLELQIDANFDIIVAGRNYAIACITLLRTLESLIVWLALNERLVRCRIRFENSRLRTSISTVSNHIVSRARIFTVYIEPFDGGIFLSREIVWKEERASERASERERERDSSNDVVNGYKLCDLFKK